MLILLYKRECKSFNVNIYHINKNVATLEICLIYHLMKFPMVLLINNIRDIINGSTIKIKNATIGDTHHSGVKQEYLLPITSDIIHAFHSFFLFISTHIVSI